MNAIKGTYRQGKIILKEQADWPDGTEVLIEPRLREETLGMREEDWPTDKEGIARLLARMDEIEPLDMTPEEEADIAAWRKKVKDYTIAKTEKNIDRMFE
jgi:hypothetical protein